MLGAASLTRRAHRFSEGASFSATPPQQRAARSLTCQRLNGAASIGTRSRARMDGGRRSAGQAGRLEAALGPYSKANPPLTPTARSSSTRPAPRQRWHKAWQPAEQADLAVAIEASGARPHRQPDPVCDRRMIHRPQHGFETEACPHLADHLWRLAGCAERHSIAAADLMPCLENEPPASSTASFPPSSLLRSCTVSPVTA